MADQSSLGHTHTHQSPPVQSQIAAKRALGASKSQIARDLGIARNTVTNVLELNDVEQALSGYSVERVELIPFAFSAVKARLLKGDGLLGLQYLKWIFGDSPLAGKGQGIGLEMAFSQCQVIIQQAMQQLKPQENQQVSTATSDKEQCVNPADTPIQAAVKQPPEP